MNDAVNEEKVGRVGGAGIGVFEKHAVANDRASFYLVKSHVNVEGAGGDTAVARVRDGEVFFIFIFTFFVDE